MTTLEPHPANTLHKASILRKAADLIEINGLHKGSLWLGRQPGRQGSFYTPGLPCCTEGALMIVLGLEESEISLLADPAYKYLDWWINRNRGPRKMVCEWNDSPRQTQKNVVQTLRAAANALDKAKEDVRP